MKTDPTSNISGAAGTPLSYGTIHTKRQGGPRDQVSANPENAISDTFETSDREADGRRRHLEPPKSTLEAGPPPPRASGERLDLTG